ncbi:hypothetical protein L596_028240 [Steinernema carpocapsae]|uniref:Uncharacterized protein n=1 Tax=Steinernema carpocapsae TaxID=34508 RepID=A0A4U5LXW6_STECR|nr:hypothetical protein L596_028240 [Steinernema carpocapsae]
MIKRPLHRIPKQIASCSSRAAFWTPAASLTPTVAVPSNEILQKATVHPPLLKPYISEELQNEDLFKMNNFLEIEDMFDARVHYGHKIGTLNDNMKWALYGQRLGFCIFDLEITKQYMTKALNFLAHISNRGGMILFVTADRTNMLMVERMAADGPVFPHPKMAGRHPHEHEAALRISCAMNFEMRDEFRVHEAQPSDKISEKSSRYFRHRHSSFLNERLQVTRVSEFHHNRRKRALFEAQEADNVRMRLKAPSQLKLKKSKEKFGRFLETYLIEDI